MRHEADHDPILDYRKCYVCYAALSASWAKLTGLPIDTMEETIMALRKEAAGIANQTQAIIEEAS